MKPSCDGTGIFVQNKNIVKHFSPVPDSLPGVDGRLYINSEYKVVKSEWCRLQGPLLASGGGGEESIKF